MSFTNDYLYYYGKSGNHVRSLLGEIQIGEEGFNMSNVIDGTKDSMKVVVMSYSVENAIEPMTIVKHQNTSTWWVVAHDKVSRYINESGYLYSHELELIGAIELLNARDLTDCGFNNDRYTIRQFINRLFSLSDHQLPLVGIANTDDLDLDQNVDYLKTFENYTLLSALREFLDGYNCTAYLTFIEQSQAHHLTRTQLHIINKSGNTATTPIPISTFNDVKEVRTMSKESFGTTVVSNADNVVATKAKVFPLIGGAKVSSSNYLILGDSNANVDYNADCIRLPSKVHSVEWVKMYNGRTPAVIQINTTNFGQAWTVYYDPTDKTSILSVFLKAYTEMNNHVGVEEAIEVYSELVNNYSTFENFGEITLYGGTEYDPINKTFSNPNGSLPVFKNWNNQLQEYVLGNKTLKEGVEQPNQVMYWESGSNLIKGLEFFNHWAISQLAPHTIQNNDLVSITAYSKNVVGSYNITIYIGDAGGVNVPLQYDLTYASFKIKYVPMLDLKLKLDNIGTSHDIQLYNQNGKLTDSNALSKLLIGYSKEITSENITKYKSYYGYSNVPKVGTLVYQANENAPDDLYVINSVSSTFYINEAQKVSNETRYSYYIECEFTLSKYVATKSMMTSPNTNIRDYGIPQTNTIKRKQLYRDFFEFDYTSDIVHADSDWYLPIYKVVNFTMDKQNYQEHKALIKVTFADTNSYYYQLDTTCFPFKKSMYEIVDFQDNNIIGYDMQNIKSGFNISRILSGDYDGINTPISYVDTKGEIKDIEITFCNANQLYSVYENVGTQLLSGHVFIDATTYTAAGVSTRHDFIISEENYGKDALEIPVFEYSTQVDDTESVIVGENILQQEYGFDTGFGIASNVNGFLYTWVLVPKNTVNQYNALMYKETISVYSKNSKNGFGFASNDIGKNGACIFSANENSVGIAFYNEVHKAYDGTITTETMTTDLDTSYDIVIFRTPLGSLLPYNNNTELMFIIRNAELFTHTAHGLTLKVNHYKLR